MKPSGVDLTPLKWPCKIICWDCGFKVEAKTQVILDMAREYHCPDCGEPLYALRRIFAKKGGSNGD